MEGFYDLLAFDNRNQEDLFPGIHSGQTHYADILKRWVNDARIIYDEQKIVSGTLIFYPGYVLENGKTEEFIELILDSLQQPDLNDPENPEKGLFMYTLFFFLLKSAAYKEALQVLCELENFFRHYNNSNWQKQEDPVFPLLFDDIFHTGELSLNKTDRLQEACLEIISRIIDTKELPLLEPDFNLDRLPLPNKTLSTAECWDSRGKALYLYGQKSYKKAKKLYHRLLMEKFELPGTLIHLARVELTAGDISQAELYVTMAWRHRVDAPPYVMARILWFRLCMVMLGYGNNEDIPLILYRIKSLLQNKEAIMIWTMQALLEQLKPSLKENDHFLLSLLVEIMSSGENITKIESLKI